MYDDHLMLIGKRGWIVTLVKYGFITLLQRMFNCDKMQYISITPNNVLNSLVYGSPFCAITYASYKLSIRSDFSWLKSIGIFGVVSFLQMYAKNI